MIKLNNCANFVRYYRTFYIKMAFKPVIENSIPVVEQTVDPPYVRAPTRKRPGRASKKASEEGFRARIGKKVVAEAHDSARKRLGTFADAHEVLEEQFRNLMLAKQACARPLTVATRGAGIVASITYSKMVTTWQLTQIEMICTIHQYYRVTLWLIHYKLYLAQQIQHEVRSYDYGDRFDLSEECREVFAVRRQVPSIVMAILNCIGKVDVDGEVWHSVYPILDETPAAEISAQFLNPLNIHGVLERYSSVDTSIHERRIFQMFCCIPGIQFSLDALILNADQVYPPEYSEINLRADFHAYSNLMQRVGHRLAPHFMGEISWSGSATKSALACTDPSPIRLVSRFSAINPPVALNKKRNVAGRCVDVPHRIAEVPRYESSLVQGSSVSSTY